MPHEITVVIPSIPPRVALLQRATRSIARQKHPAAAVSIAYDLDKKGAGPTRTRALQAVRTEWIAFLDDDDEFLPEHLEVLVRAQEDSGADVVWPWFTVVGGTDPFPMHRGRQFDPADPHIFPITTLVRTSVALEATFPAPGVTASWHGDDFPFWIRLANQGAKFHHVPDRTWHWHHHGRNTSGLPSGW